MRPGFLPTLMNLCCGVGPFMGRLLGIADSDTVTI